MPAFARCNDHGVDIATREQVAEVVIDIAALVGANLPLLCIVGVDPGLVRFATPAIDVGYG